MVVKAAAAVAAAAKVAQAVAVAELLMAYLSMLVEQVAVLLIVV